MVSLSRWALAYKPSDPKALYKYLLKACQTLPTVEAKFYRRSVKKEYEQHWDETDPERVQQIMERAVRDAEWIQTKYAKKA